MAQWYQRNKEEQLAKKANWYRDNKEQALSDKMRYYYEHKDEESARAKVYHEQHKDKKNARSKNWREQHLEYDREYTKGYLKTEKGRIVRHNAKAKRRALKKGAFVENVDAQIVFERDKGICGICKLPVERDFDVDHIVPLSKGGEHSYSNVQLAHPKCNREKGTRLPSGIVNIQWTPSASPSKA